MSGQEQVFPLKLHEVKQTLVVGSVSLVELEGGLALALEIDLQARAVGELPAVFIHGHQAEAVLLSTSDLHMLLKPE